MGSTRVVRRWCAASWWLALMGLLLASGCVTQRGGPWRAIAAPAVAEADAGAPSLILLGELGAGGATASAVAERLETSLAEERAAGRTPIILWLGDSGPTGRRKRCEPKRSVRSQRGHDALMKVIDTHRERGQAAFAIAGEAETRCDSNGRTPPDRGGTGSPFEQPAPQYTLALGPDGQTTVTLACTATDCVSTPAPANAIVELVFVDIAPWIATTHDATRDAKLRALDQLLDSVLATTTPRPAEPGGSAVNDAQVPRILVSHYPIEAAGYHGLGGGDPDSTIHNWPPRLKQAIADGEFVGAFGSHDRSTYATTDISSALKRADRIWVPHAVFQIVSGAGSAPDALPRNAYRRLRYLNSSTYVPTAFTPRAGFAVVRLDGSHTQVALHARHGRRWKTAQVPVSLAPAPKAALTRSPSMAPCLRCPEKPYSEQP